MSRARRAETTEASELHEQWNLEADYREGYERLELDFEVARALIEARALGVHSGGVGDKDEDDTIGGCAYGKRPNSIVCTDAREVCRSDRHSLANKLRAKLRRARHWIPYARDLAGSAPLRQLAETRITRAVYFGFVEFAEDVVVWNSRLGNLAQGPVGKQSFVGAGQFFTVLG